MDEGREQDSSGDGEPRNCCWQQEPDGGGIERLPSAGPRTDRSAIISNTHARTECHNAFFSMALRCAAVTVLSNCHVAAVVRSEQ